MEEPIYGRGKAQLEIKIINLKRLRRIKNLK